MTRLNALLLLLVVASAMALVHTQYESRRLVMLIEAEGKEAARLAIEHERLQVERRAQATPLRVEQIARQQLQMRMVSPGITVYVQQGATASGAGARP
ncbi:MAG: cell division protein FtsL [Betaproteobacteria bacterium]|nr:cell division protein FtsL [Betaproteobacteria bacterium]